MKRLNHKKLLPEFLRKKSIRKKPGTAPGHLVHTGERLVEEAQLEVYDFDENDYHYQKLDSIEKSDPFLESPTNTWINVCGLHDIEKLKTIWGFFDLHPLIQEDIININQRPKIEHYKDYIFIVLRLITYHEEKQKIISEQVSIVLGKNFVLSFQESDYPVFNPVVHRLKSGAPRLRKSGSDYLSYALIDTVVDHYYSVIEKVGDDTEKLEEQIMEEDSRDVSRQIHALRRQLIFLRKSLMPTRESLNGLLRDESVFIAEENKIFYRDVYDHVVQILDNVENFRDMAMGLLDMHMTQVSNKMNEVMKILTIIATIFIPLTFIAGIYGMNFDPEAGPWNMPELSSPFGYVSVWAVMIIVAALMMIYFRRKKWL